MFQSALLVSLNHALGNRLKHEFQRGKSLNSELNNTEGIERSLAKLNIFSKTDIMPNQQRIFGTTKQHKPLK